MATPASQMKVTHKHTTRTATLLTGLNGNKNCYFLKPFHELNENFLFALEDIARMNDFRVRVNVTHESRESSTK